MKEAAMSSLLLRTLIGFIALVLILGLCLFLPAGSLSFWQAWVYLGVFSVCVILITVYLIRFDRKLLARRVKGGPTAETQKSQQVIQSLASLFFIGLYIVAGLDYRFHWSDVPLAVIVFSDAMVVLSFFIIFLVFRENSYTSAVIEVSDEQRVISSGPYRMVRHPMYAGAIPLLIFTPLALGSWIAVPFAVPLILVIAARLLAEEKFLDKNLSGYPAYRQKVRYRLIPLIW
jgi:protein-S-isoprenylcysteine O-methyltransferase Ste14